MPSAMSPPVRDILIEHLAGPVSIVVSTKQGRAKQRIIEALRQRGWLARGMGWRPQYTFITKEGRRQLDAVLDDMREALLRAEANKQALKMAG